MEESSAVQSPRTPEQIMDDVAAGRLELSNVNIRETVTIEKFDLSGPEKKLIETVKCVDGVITEVIEHP